MSRWRNGGNGEDSWIQGVGIGEIMSSVLVSSKYFIENA